MSPRPTFAALTRSQATPPAGDSSADPMTLSALRASLKPGGPPAGPLPSRTPARSQRNAATIAPAGPTAETVLASSPNARRLCLTYDGSRRRTNRQGRTQRVGLGALVSAAMVTAAILAQQRRIDVVVLNHMVLAVAVLGATALGILAVLWLRDERRNRALQGERLVRALGLNCSMAREHLDTWLGEAPAAARFFELYAYWRSHATAEAAAA